MSENQKVIPRGIVVASLAPEDSVDSQEENDNHRLIEPHMFSLGEIAMAYALAAEQMFGDNAALLNSYPATVPIFVNMLFQSLEISIKHAGIASGLFTMEEARDRKNRGKKTRSGHGVKELVILVVEKLDGSTFDQIIAAMTKSNSNDRSHWFIHEMICGTDFERTRELYSLRDLGYCEVREGDFAMIDPTQEWISAVKETAINLGSTINIFSQLRQSISASKQGPI